MSGKRERRAAIEQSVQAVMEKASRDIAARVGVLSLRCIFRCEYTATGNQRDTNALMERHYIQHHQEEIARLLRG
jgi:hypothetical protein